jgi:hypothetical protein
MSFRFVDTPELVVHIPTSFKRMAELRRPHRDATSCGLDIHNLYQIPPFAFGGKTDVVRVIKLPISYNNFSTVIAEPAQVPGPVEAVAVRKSGCSGGSAAAAPKGSLQPEDESSL